MRSRCFDELALVAEMHAHIRRNRFVAYNLHDMLTSFILSPDGSIRHDTSREAIAAALQDKDTKLWLDIEAANDDEVRYLSDVFQFHELAIEDSTARAQRPKLESYNHADESACGGYYYMVIHGPDLQTYKEKLRTKELDIFFSPRFLLTMHDEKMKSVTDTIERARADGKLLSQGIDRLLYNILDRLVDNYDPIFDHLGEQINRLEDGATTSVNEKMLRRINHKKRELMHLRRIIGPQRDVISQLTRGEVEFISNDTRIYLRDVQDHLIRAVETVEIYRDLILGARDVYLASVSNQLNQIMKTLTIITVIALPMTVVTSFFGMNFDAIPGLHSVHGFWITVVAMIVTVAGLLMLFRKKRWI